MAKNVERITYGYSVGDKLTSSPNVKKFRKEKNGQSVFHPEKMLQLRVN